MPELKDFSASEQFVISLGEIIEKVAPDLLNKPIEDISRRKIASVISSVAGDLVAGDSDSGIDFSQIKFQLAISDYKRMKTLLGK